MLILNIDTAIDKGSYCISNNNDILAFDFNDYKNSHAGWLHESIRTSVDQLNIDPDSFDAIAVSNGPGSYTGLRIGLAAAKGFCYALKKPLICINTLQIIAHAVQGEATDLICPMIDARRMEVFTAVYDKSLNVINEPFAEVLTEDSFSDIINNHHVVFTGNGCSKFKKFAAGKEVSFIEKELDARQMVSLSTTLYREKSFADVAYCEPYYVKDVYIIKK